MTCSVGAVIAREQSVDFDSLFMQADNALYEAKRDEKGGIAIRNYCTLDKPAESADPASPTL